MARLLVLATMTVGGMLCGSAPAHPLQADRPATAVALARLSVPFVPNAGQWDQAAAFGARTLGGTLFVTGKGELVYSLPGLPVADAGCESPAVRQVRKVLPLCLNARRGPGWVFTETLVDGSLAPRQVTAFGAEQSNAAVSYFIGNEPHRHASAIKSYDRLSLGEVYPGIAVQLRATQNNVEKIFAVSPHHDPGQIRLRLAGIDAAELGADGELIVRTGNGPVSFTAPIAYQEESSGARTPVPAAYRLDAAQHSYGFTVGSYDRTRPLIIDPLLRATYLGAAGSDVINAVAIHPATGDVYVTGMTSSTGSTFPGVAGGAQPANAGGAEDAFVSRFSGDLLTLRSSTYLGAGGDDAGYALAIHPVNLDIYVAGNTTSPGSTFPGTASGYQSSNGGGSDVFIARLNPGLTTLVRSTYLGAAGFDNATALIANPANGDIYVAGLTTSSGTSFPGSAGGAQTSFGGGIYDAFVARLDASLMSLVQSTYLGGGGTEAVDAIAVHPVTGAIYVTGGTSGAIFPGTATGAQPANGGGSQDAFVSRLNPALTNIVRSTFFGGAGVDGGTAIAIHPMTGDVYIAGITDSPGTSLPGTAGGAQPGYGSGTFDAFVAQFDASLKTIKQATYLGGGASDYAYAMAVHPVTGDIYVAGGTDAGGSTPFPGVAGGWQAGAAGGNDAFISRLSADLTTLVQSTYYGGGGMEYANGLVVDPFSGDVLIAGVTGSPALQGTTGSAQSTYAGDNEGFVSRFTYELRQVQYPLSVPLTFAPKLNVPPGTEQFSNALHISGPLGPTPVDIVGGAFARYCISSSSNCNCDLAAYGNATGTIFNNQWLCLKQQAPLVVPGVSATTIIVGYKIGTFFVTTGTDLNACTLDVDGNGAVDALTDGLILLRAMFGLTGTAAINGAVGSGASRNTWALIQTYLNNNCGTSFVP